jgi:isoquinoline 1-oxidoreductase subunit alpha
MAGMNLLVNTKKYQIDVTPETPLLWVLRNLLDLTGTKFGCGTGLCGACTVHLDGEAVRSCQTEVGKVGSRKIRTIEGLAADRNHPVVRAWLEEQVPQCRYCQIGTNHASGSFPRYESEAQQRGH